MTFFYCTEPPEEFSTKMSNKQFLLYLNANGIYYDVCKELKGTIESDIQILVRANESF